MANQIAIFSSHISQEILKDMLKTQLETQLKDEIIKEYIKEGLEAFLIQDIGDRSMRVLIAKKGLTYGINFNSFDVVFKKNTWTIKGEKPTKTQKILHDCKAELKNAFREIEGKMRKHNEPKVDTTIGLYPPYRSDYERTANRILSKYSEKLKNLSTNKLGPLIDSIHSKFVSNKDDIIFSEEICTKEYEPQYEAKIEQESSPKDSFAGLLELIAEKMGGSKARRLWLTPTSKTEATSLDEYSNYTKETYLPDNHSHRNRDTETFEEKPSPPPGMSM